MRSILYQEILWLEIHYAEYRATCHCCTSFHSHPPGAGLKAKYDDKVRQAVIDRVLEDKLNLSTVQQSMKRDFLLNLSTGYIYAALDYAIRQFDGNAFRQRVLSEFSGTLCIDEIHLGRRVVLLASDPVADNPVACALVSKNDAKHMRRFMQNLKNRGFSPHTVISDRSPLYLKTLAEVWPDANHQFCLFHIIADINKQVLDAVRELHRELKPKQIKKGRGRPNKRQRVQARKRKEQRRQADFVFHHRYLMVRRRSNMTTGQKKTLARLQSISPTLKTLRKFVDDVHQMFSLRRSKTRAWNIWRRIRRTRKYLSNKSLKLALELLSKGTMRKLLVYLDQPLSCRRRVRTNNHVERCNRKLRYLEKVRYKWRRPRTIIRHILLQFQNWISTNVSPA